MLQKFTAEAGADGAHTKTFSVGRSIAIQLRDTINNQANEVVMIAFAVVAVGLLFCAGIALRMEMVTPGSSLSFQKRMAALGLVGAAGIAGAMCIWSSVDHAVTINNLADQYDQLAHSVPSSPPPEPPSVQRLVMASGVSISTGLHGAAIADQPESVSVVSHSEPLPEPTTAPARRILPLGRPHGSQTHPGPTPAPQARSTRPGQPDDTAAVEHAPDGVPLPTQQPERSPRHA